MIAPLAVFAIGISAFLTYLTTKPSSRMSTIDLPNERSLHNTPIPRGGGIAILTAFYICSGIALFRFDSGKYEFFWLVAGSILLASVSYLDDRKEVSAFYRLVVHFIVACFLIACGVIPNNSLQFPQAVVTASYLLSTVWLINLYNFMDGMDGFAAGMAVSGFAFYAVFGWLHGGNLFFVVCLILSLANLGFLIFNFPPARIFMGDVGSAPLGFLCAGLSLWGIRDGIFPMWVPLLVFSPFIVDATVTLIKRLLKGEKVWHAHRSHYYQRLVQLGWGHKKTVLAEYGLMAAVGLSALYLTLFHEQEIVVLGLTAWAIVYFLFAIIIKRMERKGQTHKLNE